MKEKWARFAVKKRIPILIVFLVITCACAAAAFFVNINYDLTAYLPEDFATTKAIALMYDEFGDATNVTIVFKGIDAETAKNISSELALVEGVTTVQCDTSSENYVKDGYTKFTVVIGYNTYSEEATEVIDEIRSMYADRELYVSGAAVENEASTDTLSVSIAIAFAILLVILFIASSSWFDPVVYLLTIGIAVVINMGTNVFFSSISSITNSVTAILQLVLSMDYSIMLMNRYRRERTSGLEKEDALVKALTGGAGSIVSSAVTTVVGLLCLVFMSFTIGIDMGVVLAKGVVISLICVFAVLPGLIIIFDKPLTKCMKKRLTFKKSARNEVSAPLAEAASASVGESVSEISEVSEAAESDDEFYGAPERVTEVENEIR